MTEGIANDLRDFVEALSTYLETGSVIQHTEYKFKSMLIGKPESPRVKPLEKLHSCSAKSVVVDWSTRTLKRAND
jgi:DNA polymerase/3'-5' exonuclease PolX